MVIRDETPADVTAIREITNAAFRLAPRSDGTEARIIDELRAAGGLTLSLVADQDGDVIGHVAFSPVITSGKFKGVYGLGPISVHPDRQKRGIGSTLVRSGLERLRQIGAAGCVLLGSPKFYGRFGFKVDAGRCPAGLPPQFFQTFAFDATLPTGELRYHPAFGITAT